MIAVQTIQTRPVAQRRLIVGIDPGASGAIAVIDADTKDLVHVSDMPTELIISKVKGGKSRRRISPSGLAQILTPFAGSTLWIEDVAARPGQGVSSMFAFGLAAGLAQGVCAALGMQMHKVSPQRWQRHFDLWADKTSHREVAARIYGDQEKLFKRVKDDGRADAVLIATYGAYRTASTVGSYVVDLDDASAIGLDEAVW